MATVHEKPKSARPSRYDAVVEGHLDRARSRIRTLDVTVGLLGFLAGTLGFALIMTVLDRWLELTSLARQLAFAGYLLAAIVYLAAAVALPLMRRLNPYYAARKVEQSIPDAKNSVINWLDLHDDNLPAAIHGALGARAARDLAQVDIDQAISSRRATWLGGTAGTLFLVLIVLLALWGVKPFFSLLGRTFAPFVETTIATRTRIEIIRPEGGDATVPVDQSVYVAVHVEGRIPDPGRHDSLRLLLRYQQSDPYEEQPLERENGREWITVVPAFRVQNGFFYKIRGGDSETPEHRVRVRSTPLITGFDVAYHYRPYLGFKDDASRDPNLKAHRGTAVVLTAHTNRTVRTVDSVLELNLSGMKKTVRAEAAEDDPQALRFSFVIEQNGTYRILFSTTDGEKNADPMPYTIQALTDHPPQVEIRKPGQDVTLPVNGLLKLEGSASDDIGVAAITLMMRVEGGPVLRSKAYRNGKDFKLADGSHPRVLEYRDFVELARIVDLNDRPVTLAPKMVVEYWLEAKDGCDYLPGPNVGESKKYKVVIAEAPPMDKQQQDKQRQQAQQEQQRHEQQQDQQIAKENEARKDGDKNPEKKPEDKGGQQGDKPQDPEEAKRQEDLKKQEEQIRDALEKLQEQKAGAKADPDPENKGNAKDEPPKDEKERKEPEPGQGKPQEKPGEGADDKGGGKGGEAKPDAGGAKGGAPQDGKDDRGGNKDGGQKQPGAGDGQGKPSIPDNWEKGNPGRGKDNGLPPEEKLSRVNEGDAPNKGDNRPQAKDAAGAGEGDDAPAGAKDDPKRLTRSNSKDRGPEGEPKGGAKNGGEPKEPANAKQGGEKKDNDVARAEKKGDGEEKEGKPEDAKKEDVDRLAKKTRSGKKKEDRDEAKKQLEEVRDKARDPTAREAARRELEKQREQEPGLARENDKPKEGECAQCKGGGPKKPGECAQCKGGGNGGGGNPGEGKPTEKEGDGPKVARGTGKGGNDETTARKPGGGPGAEDNPNVVDSPDPLPKGQIDPEHARKVAELQLEEFRKKVNKKVLDDAKISQEDFERFLRGWVEMKRKQGLLPQDNEKLPAPQQGGSLPSVGATKVTGGQDRGGDVKAGSKGKAPPGFQDIVNKFTRDLSATKDASPEKK